MPRIGAELPTFQDLIFVWSLHAPALSFASHIIYALLVLYSMCALAAFSCGMYMLPTSVFSSHVSHV